MKSNIASKFAITLAAFLVCTSAHAQIKVKIGHTPLNEVLIDFVAIDKGFFKTHGIDAEAQLLRSTSVIIPGLISDEIQIGAVTAPSLLQAIDGGLPLIGLNGLDVFTPEYKGVAVIARTGSKMTLAKDFLGKRVLTGAYNSTTSIVIKHWLRSEGIDPKRITFVEVPMASVGDVLKAGSADAGVSPDPQLYRNVSSGSTYVVKYVGEIVPNRTVSMVNVISKDWAAKNPEGVKGILLAMKEATAWAKANQDEALQITAKYLGMPLEMLKTSAFPIVDDGLTAEQVQWWIDALKQDNLLRTDLTPAQVTLP
jgi:NitT/TauT family transport system substrate-binding protein